MSAQPQERTAQMSQIAREVPLHIVLVEPQIPPNTGNVARLCAATGCALHLVEPLGFRIDDRDLKRAGLDYWQHLSVVVHASLDAFLAGTQDKRRWYASVRAGRSYLDAEFAYGDMLLFGKETRGLPRDLLEGNSAWALRIPQRPDSVRSLNLSTAAGILTYGALARLGFPGLR